MAQSTSLKEVVLICGEDDFAVKERAKQVYGEWCGSGHTVDQEIIDAGAGNSSEALRALAKLREALQTLPFFGSGKAVWFQNCTFLGDERAAGTQAVSDNLASLAQELKSFPWGAVRLLITAGKVDKRKTFYKTLEKIGTVETFAGWSPEDRNWTAEAERFARRELTGLGKSASGEALAKLVAWVGPNPRQLHMEIEKVASYAGDRPRVEVTDVDAVATHNKQSRAFALGDALGERNLQKALRTLDEELWLVKRDSQKSEIGLLYGLISKVRTMIFLKEMVRAGWLKPERDYSRFKAQLEAVPAQSLPEDRRFNPLGTNPYVLFRALEHARHYSLAELTGAMDLLLQCNQSLVLSSADEAGVLRQTLIKIIRRTEGGRLS